MKNKNVKSYYDNDILNKIFEQRENEIYEIKEDEKKLFLKRKNEYSNIFIAIDNVPDAFTETRKFIMDSIEKYLETTNEIQGIENERFYKEGFSDAVKLILNCYKTNKNNEKSKKKHSKY